MDSIFLQVGHQAGQTSGFTLRTATRVIQLWSWSKVAAPTPGYLSETCLFHRSPLTAGTWLPHSAGGEWRVSAAVWRRRRHERVREGQSLPTYPPSPMSPPSSNCGEFLQRRTMNGRKWYETSGALDRIGNGWIGYRAGRNRMPGNWGRSTWRWYNRSYNMVQRHRSWPHVCRGWWADSTIGWTTYWQGDKHRRDGMEAGFNPLWRMECRRRGYRRWRTTSLAYRTPWRNILQIGPLWTCVLRQSGGQDQEWKCGGGNRRVWIWMGYGWRPTRRSGQRGTRRRKGRRLQQTISKVRRIV